MPVTGRPSRCTSPALGRSWPEDAVEQGRLAAAVGADDAENLALVDLERHAVDGDDAAEALSEIVDGEDGAHRARLIAADGRGDRRRALAAGLNRRSTRPSRPAGQNTIRTITSTA